jgi:hypothetical protein
MYFLGLARWFAGKKDLAKQDFQAGAALERQGRPSPRAISDSIERIQGDTRSLLNEYRP